MSEKKGGSIFIIILAIILFLGTIGGVWGYLIKTNKYINLGEKLRPFIQDIPVINMILPDSSAEADPTTFSRSELEEFYASLKAENESLAQKNSQLEGEVGPLKETEEKYNILLKEVATLKETITILEAKSSAAAIEAEKMKSLVKVYESMEAAEAAAILESMGSLNMNLVMNICKNMKSASVSEIMQEMDTDFAAILSERMLED
ncbi:MAG: hypothetical protein E7314_05130 [Clostridiales bacterium]|nr:hypothetical protein [Clostridiales bacterium]